MYSVSDFRKGLKVELDGQPYIMVECQFVKPGKGNAFARTKLKHMVTGAVLDRTYKSGEKIDKANLMETAMEFLYSGEDTFHFMNNSTYEQEEIHRDNLGDAPKWLHENLEVSVLFHNGKPISIELPNFVTLQIIDCDPGVKGDTKSNVTKRAVVSTGTEIQVPIFVDTDEWVKVDTRTGDYSERVKK